MGDPWFLDVDGLGRTRSGLTSHKPLFESILAVCDVDPSHYRHFNVTDHFFRGFPSFKQKQLGGGSRPPLDPRNNYPVTRHVDSSRRHIQPKYDAKVKMAHKGYAKSETRSPGKYLKKSINL